MVYDRKKEDNNDSTAFYSIVYHKKIESYSEDQIGPSRLFGSKYIKVVFKVSSVPFLFRLAATQPNHIKLPFLNSSSWVEILDLWVKINLSVNITFMSSFFNMFSISTNIPSSIPRLPGLKGTFWLNFKTLFIKFHVGFTKVVPFIQALAD